MFRSCKKCLLSCQIHSSSSLLSILRFRLGGGPIRLLTSPNTDGPGDDSEFDDDDDDAEADEDDEHGCKTVLGVGCW